jgi:hypothetical protein
MEHPGAYARRILVNLAIDGARGRVSSPQVNGSAARVQARRL